jgi:hypothetical protein
MTAMSNVTTELVAAPLRHVSLDGQDEAVKRFVLDLIAEDAGSVLELAGRAVAQVLPPPASRNGWPAPADDWTAATDARRCDLIDREVDGTLTEAERTELEDLQEQMLRHRHRVAPLPLAHARQLLEELERKAGTALRPTP